MHCYQEGEGAVKTPLGELISTYYSSAWYIVHKYNSIARYYTEMEQAEPTEEWVS